MANKTINIILNNLSKKYQQEYGFAVFSVKAKKIKSGISINGIVLTENQKEDVLNIFEKEEISIVKNNIKVLSDASKRSEIGWGIVKTEVADLKSRFVSNKIINEKILKRVRCSQTFEGEVVRVLYKNEDQLLVQQNDLTLGWVNKKDVAIKKKNLLKKWKVGSFAIRNGMIKHAKQVVQKSSIPLLRGDYNQLSNSLMFEEKDTRPTEKIIKEAEKYIGAKYILGGKSKKGIDCSGFTQVAYKNSLDIILPKHSWDQKKVGKKIKLEKVKSGDLIFLVKKKNGHKHVGIVEVIPASRETMAGQKYSPLERGQGCVKLVKDASNTPLNPLSRGEFNQLSNSLMGRDMYLIHASLDEKKVVRQNINEVFKNYDFVEARRIVE